MQGVVLVDPISEGGNPEDFGPPGPPDGFGDGEGQEDLGADPRWIDTGKEPDQHASRSASVLPRRRQMRSKSKSARSEASTWLTTIF